MAMRQFLTMHFHGGMKRLMSLWANSKKNPHFSPIQSKGSLEGLAFKKKINQSWDFVPTLFQIFQILIQKCLKESTNAIDIFEKHRIQGYEISQIHKYKVL